MPIHIAHLKTVLLAKGWTYDPRLDVWLNPKREWFHLFPDGILQRLSPVQIHDLEPATATSDAR
jgi:hypothetical protein